MTWVQFTGRCHGHGCSIFFNILISLMFATACWSVAGPLQNNNHGHSLLVTYLPLINIHYLSLVAQSFTAITIWSCALVLLFMMEKNLCVCFLFLFHCVYILCMPLKISLSNVQLMNVCTVNHEIVTSIKYLQI